MENGFIYPLVSAMVYCFNGLNLVEFFKFIAKKLTSDRDRDKIIHNLNIAIDVFIVFKWIIIISFWYTGYNTFIAKIVTFYLIIMNLHTYFYYHVWSDRAIIDERSTHDRLKRRFISLVLAISFSVFSYAYLYSVCYFQDFLWPNKIPTFIDAIQYSVSVFITGSSNVSVISDTGNLLVISQYISTFIFVAIILTRSIPNQPRGNGGK